MIDEATGRPAAAVPWRSWSPGDPVAPATGRRRRRLSPPGVVLVAVLLLAAALFTLRDVGVSFAGDPVPDGWPTPGHGAADAPLGTPLPLPHDGGAHVFIATQDDGVRPVTYDPCRPIHYVIRPDNAPVGGDSLVHEAFARVSAVTGLQFVYDGPTDEAATEGRDSFQPDRYGDRWAPVLVAWQTETENPGLAGNVAGMAGSAAVEPPGGPRVFVTGFVSLDVAAFDPLMADPAGVATARAIVLHELGHLVGLAHVSDAGQLMYPSTSAVLDFAPGDLSGLAELGRGECVPGL